MGIEYNPFKAGEDHGALQGEAQGAVSSALRSEGVKLGGLLGSVNPRQVLFISFHFLDE